MVSWAHQRGRDLADQILDDAYDIRQKVAAVLDAVRRGALLLCDAFSDAVFALEHGVRRLLRRPARRPALARGLLGPLEVPPLQERLATPTVQSVVVIRTVPKLVAATRPAPVLSRSRDAAATAAVTRFRVPAPVAVARAWTAPVRPAAEPAARCEADHQVAWDD
jgi:hypothetical protein